MKNPWTTIPGYIGLVGAFLGGIASHCGGGEVCHGIMLGGVILTGLANSLGNIFSQDGSH